MTVYNIRSGADIEELTLIIISSIPKIHKSQLRAVVVAFLNAACKTITFEYNCSAIEGGEKLIEIIKELNKYEKEEQEKNDTKRIH